MKVKFSKIRQAIDKTSIGEGSARGYHNAFDKRITYKQDFKSVRGALMKYADNNSPRPQPMGFDRPYRFTVTAGEDLKKYQYGLLVFTIDEGRERKRIIVSMDALMSIIYSVYPQK